MGWGAPDRRERGRRRLLRAVIVLVGVLVAVFVAAAWYVSSLLIDGARIKDSSGDLPHRVIAAAAGSITLLMDTAPKDDPRSDAIAGVRLPSDAYLQVGAVEQVEGNEATRPVTRVFGSLPTRGSAAALESRYFPQDPLVGLGLDFTEVPIQTPLGSSPAWYVPGSSDTWAIYSHGLGGTRQDGLRMLPTTSALGLPTLLVTFRDDLVGQREDGISNFGLTEWPDLEAAVRYALDHGARNVVLLAASTGAAVSMAFLENSDLADAVVAMAFDAPVTSLEQSTDLAAARTRLPVVGWPIPAPLIEAAKWLVERRVLIDFTATDYLSRAHRLDVPTLILHGSLDDINPLAASETFAATAPEGVVRLEVFDGAAHVWSWNRDPARYNRLLAEHLRSVTAPPAS